jgi:hypothetical protein
LQLVWRTNWRAVVALAVVILLESPILAFQLWIGKLIIDAIVAAIGGTPISLTLIFGLVAAEGGLKILSILFQQICYRTENMSELSCDGIPPGKNGSRCAMVSFRHGDQT